MDASMADYSRYGFHRTIKYSGIFDFNAFYTFMINWIKEHDFDFQESKVIDKPPYKIFKFIGRRKSNYYAMLLLTPEIWLWDAKPVEIIKEGIKKTLTEARMKVIVNGGYILDYDGDFEGNPSLKSMEALFVNKIMYHEFLLKYFDYLDYFLYNFMTDIKKFLEMETATNAY